jgi:hypothetical protein
VLDEYSVDHYLAKPDVRAGAGAGGDGLLFHYASAASLEAILASGNIRLNTLDRMNDPRERKDWVARDLVVPEGDLDWSMLAEQGAVADEPNRLLRLGARIACFTQEREPLPGADPDALFHRGWARARMWHQYAAAHTGACLVFDMTELVDAVDSARKIGNGDVFSISPVRYADKPLRLPLFGAFADVAAIQSALDDLTSDGKQIADLFFSKNTDWQSEDEVRILVLLWAPSSAIALEPLDLPYGDSLKAIVLGEDFGDPAWFRAAVADRGLSEDDVLRADWVDGAPTLKPYIEEWVPLV